MADLEIGEFKTQIYDSGSGNPIVFCHGSASDYRTWQDQNEAITANGYRMVTYSRRYHWPNTPATDETNYSMAEHVEDLAAVTASVSTKAVT